MVPSKRASGSHVLKRAAADSAGGPCLLSEMPVHYFRLAEIPIIPRRFMVLGEACRQV